MLQRDVVGTITNHTLRITAGAPGAYPIRAYASGFPLILVNPVSAYPVLGSLGIKRGPERNSSSPLWKAYATRHRQDNTAHRHRVAVSPSAILFSVSFAASPCYFTATIVRVSAFVDGVLNPVGYFSPKPTIRSKPMCANHTRATETAGWLSASSPRAARRPGVV